MERGPGFQNYYMFHEELKAIMKQRFIAGAKGFAEKILSERFSIWGDDLSGIDIEEDSDRFLLLNLKELVETAGKRWEEFYLNNPGLAGILRDAGEEFLKTYRYQEAEKLLTQSKEILEHISGNELFMLLELIRVLFGLGELAEKMANSKKMFRYLSDANKKADELKKLKPEEKAIRLYTTSLSKMGDYYLNIDLDKDKAEKYYLEYYHITKQLYEKDRDDASKARSYARSCSRLMIIYFEKSAYNRSLELFEEHFDIFFKLISQRKLSLSEMITFVRYCGIYAAIYERLGKSTRSNQLRQVIQQLAKPL